MELSEALGWKDVPPTPDLLWNDMIRLGLEGGGRQKD